ncbi:shikimate kinase [Salsipaludibacter albus]|uniref:shikimate kinase n=1 Tax=Salsipaludibacter albus TaxID=2849650 RepID=UPI001EE3CA62|nr:shikimate kinase [Salsipaludibacter albus]MBY5164047.1 shikimate kinase [Salsipaludibacter albus]
MSSTISLSGMMGAGKSTVGRALAARLGRRLVDTDEEIARWVGRSIPEIFAQEGEGAFRHYEAVVVRELAAVPDLVLALGGGTVLADGPVADLTLTGVLVHLDVPVDTLVARVGTGDGRPLLGDDAATRVAEVKAARDDRYLAVADVVIDADQPVDEVVDAVLGWLRHHRDVLTPSELEAILP